MKTRKIAIVTVLGLAMALASAVLVSKPAAAKCYDQQKQPIPCPKTKSDYQLNKPTATDTPKPTETPTPQLLSQQAVVAAPDAAQLAILCANLPGGGGGSSTTGGTGGNPVPNTPPAPPQPGVSPFLLGGGGLVGGILIGLLLPAISRGFSWGRNFDGNGFVGPDRSLKLDKFQKADGGRVSGFTVKLDKSEAALNYSKQGEAGFDDLGLRDANLFEKHGEAGFDDLGLRGGGKFAKGVSDAGSGDIAGMQDMHYPVDPEV